MKCIASFLCSLLLTGCVHVEKTTSRPITGVLFDSKGSPIAGAQVWAYCKLPSGLFAAPRNTSFGPALTKQDGSFVLEMKPVSMVQTGTVFDGSTTPSLLILHRERGCFSTGSLEEKKDLGFQKLIWPTSQFESPGAPSFSMIDQLSPEDQAIARSYVHGR